MCISLWYLRVCTCVYQFVVFEGVYLCVSVCGIEVRTCMSELVVFEGADVGTAEVTVWYITCELGGSHRHLNITVLHRCKGSTNIFKSILNTCNISLIVLRHFNHDIIRNMIYMCSERLMSHSHLRFITRLRFFSME